MASADCSPVLKALADRTRQRIVRALLEHELSVNELTSQLAMSQYNTSKHLSVLKSAAIVEVRAVGRRREYFISPAIRRRLRRDDSMLDFGCCTFRMDQLAE